MTTTQSTSFVSQRFPTRKREALGNGREAPQHTAELQLPTKHFPRRIRKGKRSPASGCRRDQRGPWRAPIHHLPSTSLNTSLNSFPSEFRFPAAGCATTSRWTTYCRRGAETEALMVNSFKKTCGPSRTSTIRLRVTIGRPRERIRWSEFIRRAPALADTAGWPQRG
jgi:hypothetical protein